MSRHGAWFTPRGSVAWNDRTLDEGSKKYLEEAGYTYLGYIPIELVRTNYDNTSS